MQFDITSFEQLKDAAGWLIGKYPTGGIFTLQGDLGAGKTTFVTQVVELLNIGDDVSSPTYSLVNIYEGNSLKVHHLDLYRLNSLSEAFGIGIEEIIEDADYCFIEWPEVIEEILSDDVIKLYFSHSEASRTLTIRE